MNLDLSQLLRASPIQTDILIVDDYPDNLRLLSRFLTNQGYNVHQAISGSMALKVVEDVIPDLILLDIMMPEMDGYEVCRQLKTNEKTVNIPVIFLSALNESFDKIQAFEVGGIDYITKPFHLAEVLIRIKHHIDLQNARQEILVLNSKLEKRVEQRTQELEITVKKLQQESLERQRLQTQLLEKALHDDLTGLSNRTGLIEHLTNLINSYQNQKNYQFGLLLIYCDRFKIINNALGHHIGDQLLITIGHCLQACVSQLDFLARLREDEFAIVLSDKQRVKKIQNLAEEIILAFSEPFSLENRELFINVSIGIVLANQEYQLSEQLVPEHLIRDAETAIYQFSKLRKKTYQIFNRNFYSSAIELLELESNLSQAINEQKLILHYQPILELKTGKIAGIEALVRWSNPQGEIIFPSAFVSVAEETGLIFALDNWVLKEACKQLKNWQQQRLVSKTTFISINISLKSLSHPKFLDLIEALIRDNKLTANNLALEITGSKWLKNSVEAQRILNNLQSQKIQLILDNFGTGEASLKLLQSIPLNAIKIEQFFLEVLKKDKNSLGIIPEIISIGEENHLQVIAQGIETLEQLEKLKKTNCNLGQGFLFSEPLDAQNLQKNFLNKNLN